MFKTATTQQEPAKRQRRRAYGNPFVIAIGKIVRVLARLKGGGGSAVPGLVVDKIAPNFAPKVLQSLPYGVVVVSGTNGKTTTTKIVTELLESCGLRVFTNSTGSNFMRGVVASLLADMSLGGRLDMDIAVLELDEAHAVHFVKRVTPRYALLLNVMPDQLDRFGTVEYTASLLEQVVKRTTGTVVINREDRLLAAIAERLLLDDEKRLPETFATRAPDVFEGRVLRYFGLGDELRQRFFTTNGLQPSDQVVKDLQPFADVILEAAESQKATYIIDGETCSTELSLKGLHNAYNCAAALALVRAVTIGSDATRQLAAVAVDDKAATNATNATAIAAGAGGAPGAATTGAAGAGGAPGVATAGAAGAGGAPGVATAGVAGAGGAPGVATAGAAGATTTTTVPTSASANTNPQTKALVEALSVIQSAFGRGESFKLNGREIEMLLVKNPGGFQLALESFDSEDCQVMIVVNDAAGDGRDISWLYDVDFTSLKDNEIAMISGTRAHEMALRLIYDEVSFERIETNLIDALDEVLRDASGSGRPLHIFCTYTAMMSLRAHLLALATRSTKSFKGKEGTKGKEGARGAKTGKGAKTGRGDKSTKGAKTSRGTKSAKRAAVSRKRVAK